MGMDPEEIDLRAFRPRTLMAAKSTSAEEGLRGFSDSHSKYASPAYSYKSSSKLLAVPHPRCSRLSNFALQL